VTGITLTGIAWWSSCNRLVLAARKRDTEDHSSGKSKASLWLEDVISDKCFSSKHTALQGKFSRLFYLRKIGRGSAIQMLKKIAYANTLGVS